MIYNLGRVYLEEGKKTEGIAELKRALSVAPAFPGADEARKTLASAAGAGMTSGSSAGSSSGASSYSASSETQGSFLDNK